MYKIVNYYLLNWDIECIVTKKLYRIIKQELDFYRKHNLLIPKKHPDERHMDILKKRWFKNIYARECDKCGISIKSIYSENR